MTSIIAECEEVSKLYGTFAALRKVSARLERGRCYLVLGENGAGKSTLLRTLAGLLKPSYGKVRLFGLMVRRKIRWRRGSGSGT